MAHACSDTTSDLRSASTRRRLRGERGVAGLCVPVPDRILRQVLSRERVRALALWNAMSLSERVAAVLHAGLDDLERELLARGARLHVPPTWDGCGAWGDLARVVAPHGRVRRWGRPERGRLVRGVVLPPAERRRLDAVVRGLRALDPARASSRDAVLREAVTRGAAYLLTEAPAEVSAELIEPMASFIELPHFWMRRIVGRAQLVIPARRPTRRAPRRMRRRRAPRGRRVARARASPDDGPPGDRDVAATARRSP